MSHGRGEGREVRITLCGAAGQMRTVASGANFSQLCHHRARSAHCLRTWHPLP